METDLPTHALMGLAGDRGSNARSTARRPDQGSKLYHLKRAAAWVSGASEIRILFAFDPATRAVLLVAGDHTSAASSYPPHRLTQLYQTVGLPHHQDLER
jgi:hypothetical protein